MDKAIKLAYLAGALDGDSSFSLIKGYSSSTLSPLYYPMIQLANAHKQLVELIKFEFGGSLGLRAAYRGKDGALRLPSYYWKIEKSVKCLPALSNLLPYLVVKQERACFLRDYILNNPFSRGAGKLSEAVLSRREAACLKMRLFNKNPATVDGSLRKEPHQNSDDALFWSYVAGLMDTDGSFSLKKEVRKRGGSKSPVYTPVVLLSMTDCRAVCYIMNHFIGGNMFTINAKTAKSGFCYRFSITSRKAAIQFLEKCIPFLYIKKSVASELLFFCQNVQIASGPIISADQGMFREHYYFVIKNLNNSMYQVQ